LQPHLFETVPGDAAVMSLVAVVLMITAAIAGSVPAWRATRISPTEALRSE
jgi:ABC-type antimicrobial peptide transport system permease subunit